jgi:hypothetical protein
LTPVLGQERFLGYFEADRKRVHDDLLWAGWHRTNGYRSARRLLAAGEALGEPGRQYAAGIALHLICAHLERRQAA